MKWSHLLCLALACPALNAQPIPLTTEEGFSVPQPGHVFTFPRDHGSHPDFKIEWWYLTGHLRVGEDWRFGYQATFFRFAGPREADAAGDVPHFRTDALFLAHVTLADLQTGRFYQGARLDRAGWNAVASTETLDVRHGNARLWWPEGEDAFRLVFRPEPGVGVELNLLPRKPLIIFGQDGTSRKGEDPTARSYYLTFTRLESAGTVQLGNSTLAVTGESWMDHEIASRQLGDELAGWDWTAIQFTDGREIKAYRLRQNDGTASPFSALMWIDEAGQVSYHERDEFAWEVVRWWTSPDTGRRYPIELRITAPVSDGGQRIFHLIPALDAQEVRDARGDQVYWEGACEVRDEQGQSIGRAYLELVGYGGDVSAGLR